MASYLSPRSRREPTEEAGDLFRWLAEAVQRGAAPFSFLKRAVHDHRRSIKASRAREDQAAQDLQDGGALLAHDGEERAWAVSPSVSDPLLRKQLRAALRQLTTPQRTAFLLAELEDLTAPEIAVRMGRSPGTIRNLLSEARQFLRDTLGEGSANG